MLESKLCHKTNQKSEGCKDRGFNKTCDQYPHKFNFGLFFQLHSLNTINLKFFPKHELDRFGKSSGNILERDKPFRSPLKYVRFYPGS